MGSPQGDAEAAFTDQRPAASSALDVFVAFLKLGLTSFGGPVAHLGFFRAEFVERRRWIDEDGFVDLVALCQMLPGPASSQVGVSIGIGQAGLLGGLAAWLGFTMPSAAALVAFAYGVNSLGTFDHAAWLKGLKIVAVAVVAQAVWNMAKAFCPDAKRASLAIVSTLFALAMPNALGQTMAIVLGALVGRLVVRDRPVVQGSLPKTTISHGYAIGALCVFAFLLIALPIAAETENHTVQLVSSFYRTGALVFGGGHVVLPLIQQAVVPTGWIANTTFLAGYGATQAVPGPLFAFAAFLGAAMIQSPNGWIGGMICLIAIYLPSFLLLIGALPFWDKLRRHPAMRSSLAGVNAAVVGLLLAALYDPVWISAIDSRRDFAVALLALLALAVWKMPPWLVVFGGAGTTAALAAFGF